MMGPAVHLRIAGQVRGPKVILQHHEYLLRLLADHSGRIARQAHWGGPAAGAKTCRESTEIDGRGYGCDFAAIC